MASYFISDLHLHPQRPALFSLYVDFLHWCGKNPPQALYILGDLFDAWIGDDAVTDALQPVIKALAQCDFPVFIMHGNRDFLIGEDFCRLASCELLPDPSLINNSQSTVLLSHGDMFCTDDSDYQAFKHKIRHPDFIKDFLGKPVEQRLQIARQLREGSQQAISDKTETIMDVNRQSVENVMTEYPCTTLIHGHTHRAGFHQWRHGNQTLNRLVLGDWRDHQGNFLIMDAAGYRLMGYPSMDCLQSLAADDYSSA